MPVCLQPPVSMALHPGGTNGEPPLKKHKPSPSTPPAAADPAAIQRQRQALPVYRLQARLTRELTARPTLILIGETGSGKTTQVPQFCHQAGLTKAGLVGVTQPRRVAAMSLAQRVADEMACTVGQKVGYSVRFEDCTSTQTKIKYMTDGMLLREAISDHLLRRYSTIILDEAHERTVHTDVLFGIVKKVQKIRRAKNLPELKIVVMSATMDVDHFSRYFGGAPVVYLQGRQFPVQVYYSKQKQEDPVFSSLVSVVQLHQTAPANQAVLMFLTGQEEIEAMVKNLRDVGRVSLNLCPWRFPRSHLTILDLWTCEGHNGEIAFCH